MWYKTVRVLRAPGHVMAREGKKLELYEILAAKRAKGKPPLGTAIGVDAKSAKQANAPEVDPAVTDAPGLIIDDAISDDARAQLQQHPEDIRQDKIASTRQSPSDTITQPPPPLKQRLEKKLSRKRDKHPTQFAPPGETPDVAPTQESARARSPKEVVFALDTALVFFTVILALLGCSYFIGYKRGQEERPAGLAGVAEIETEDPNRLNIRHLSPPPRAAMRPPEHDYTLIIRKEPASDDLPERLELELAEALARGRREVGRDIPGFIFRTTGADPHYILAVGLGQNANDQELNRLLKIYNDMEGINLSRQPRPYLGCRIAPVRELGTAVY